MSVFQARRRSRSGDLAHDEPARTPTGRANRRRALVFLVVFVLASAVGLAYDFLRPPIYRAASKLEITPASYTPPSETPARRARPPGLAVPRYGGRAFLTEVQKLSSRPLLEQVAARLTRKGLDLSSLGPDPVSGMQAALSVTPIPDTHVVELAATGRYPELPAELLLAISRIYRDDIARSFGERWIEARASADDEVARLEAMVAAKRSAVESYRVRYNIVSPEREENASLAQLQGLGKALQTASDRVNVAEGKAAALREAVAAGRGIARARDDPTLADLEKRASQAREDLHNMARTYTPAYMALDPNARALRANLVGLEKQIAAQRVANQKTALAEAEEELAAARDAQRRLRAQIATERQGAGQFAARFEQFKELQSELSQLQGAYRDALARRATLEATERARVPSVRVIEQAALSLTPWRPRYWRDAGAVVGSSFLLALLVMGVVELFNRPEPQPAVVLEQPMFARTLLEGVRGPLSIAAAAAPALGPDERLLLESSATLPRELSAAEVDALLHAADRPTQLAVLLIFSGLSPGEVLALRWGDVDRSTRVVHVAGPCERSVQVSPLAAVYLAATAGAADAPVLSGAVGGPLTVEVIATQLLYAAHDAGMEHVEEITCEALRHTYIAFLVRQGMRFSDLSHIVGKLPAGTLAAYSKLAPAGARAARETVNTVFPGLEPPGSDAATKM